MKLEKVDSLDEDHTHHPAVHFTISIKTRGDIEYVKKELEIQAQGQRISNYSFEVITPKHLSGITSALYYETIFHAKLHYVGEDEWKEIKCARHPQGLESYIEDICLTPKKRPLRPNI